MSTSYFCCQGDSTVTIHNLKNPIKNKNILFIFAVTKNTYLQLRLISSYTTYESYTPVNYFLFTIFMFQYILHCNVLTSFQLFSKPLVVSCFPSATKTQNLRKTKLQKALVNGHLVFNVLNVQFQCSIRLATNDPDFILRI